MHYTAPPGRRPNDPLMISDVKRGSVSHRTGTIAPGDTLLAIDNFRLEGCGIEDAAHILQNTDEIVSLRLQKREVKGLCMDSLYILELPHTTTQKSELVGRM